MKAELKQKWIAALESGKYKQGKDRLKNGEAFCCLGVLCDVIDPNKWLNDTYNGAILFLPPNISSETGIRYGIESHLSNMNDKEVPFKEIADWIRNYVK